MPCPLRSSGKWKSTSSRFSNTRLEAGIGYRLRQEFLDDHGDGSQETSHLLRKESRWSLDNREKQDERTDPICRKLLETGSDRGAYRIAGLGRTPYGAA